MIVYTEKQMKEWYSSIEGNYAINPLTKRKIKRNGYIHRSFEKNYNKFHLDINKQDLKNLNKKIKEKKNKTLIEIKISNFLENEILLRNTLKQKMYSFIILEDYKELCECEQIISVNINDYKDIKEDINKILEIIKNVYNNQKLQNKYNLKYRCKINQVDTNGNIYGFFFNSYNDNHEYPIILSHCYSKIKKKNIYICLHIQYLSFINYEYNISYDYETCIAIEY